jgi:phi13 family phage major tail protein
MERKVDNMAKKSLKGFAALSIFPVTKNDATGYTVGAKVSIPGAQSFDRTPQTTDWKQYADDGIYDSGSDWQGDQFSLVLAELALALKKYFEGGDYDDATKIYTYKSISQAPEIAITFKALLSDGTYRMYKIYSLKASSFKDAVKTKGESSDANPVTIEGLIQNRVIDNVVKDEKDTVTEADLTWLDTIDPVS